MKNASEFLQRFEDSMKYMEDAGTLFKTMENEALAGPLVQIEGREVVYFGSCSYLGLELDDRLKQGAIDAVLRYGTQFSSSRSYLAIPLYEELERALEVVFGAPALLAPTTTLGHASALPALIDEQDAVLVDHQAHSSIHQAINHLRVKGCRVELLRHDQLESLEARLKELSSEHSRIWYLVDGVYSMYGEMAPYSGLRDLLDRYPALHLYIDDAHGMSWHGRFGRGVALEYLPNHPRVIVATSLAKGFGVSGGVLILPDEALKQRVRRRGPAFIFSGPIQPANLGAALASARIHASEEIVVLQARLRELIQYANDKCKEYGLPLISDDLVPVRFIGTGLQSVVHKLIPRLLDEGFYLNAALFPAVPMTRSGLRFTVTLHQTKDDIDRMLKAVARHLPQALEEEGSSMEKVFNTFGLTPPPALTRVVPQAESIAAKFQLTHAETIEAVPHEEWDRLLGDRGVFGWRGLRLLESVFRGQSQPEHDWRFHYFIIRDAAQRPVLATFFTEALWKDDMLAAEDVSSAIELRRAEEPHYLTSRILGMGSLLSEGNHLYLDRSADWQGALTLLLRTVEELRETRGAVGVAFRDLPADDRDVCEFLEQQGYVRFSMPDAHAVELDPQGEAARFAALSRETRKSLRKKVLRHDDNFVLDRFSAEGRRPTERDLEHLHGLYRAVASRNRAINTFELPSDFLPKLLEHPGWEILTLTPKASDGGPDGQPAAFAACYRGETAYAPLICGLDYRFVEPLGAYRQLLRQELHYAHQEGFRRVLLGLGAPVEKHRLGARALANAMYLKADDDYQALLLQQHMHDISVRRQAALP